MSKTVKITEATWRRIQAMLNHVDAGRPAVSGNVREGRRVRILNTGEVPVPRYGILGIEGVATNEAAFLQHIVLTGVTPSEAAHGGGQFVICTTPLAAGAVGEAVVGGAVQVKINVTQVDHRCATVVDGQTAYLASVENGPCTILWKEDGTGEKWAVVRFAGSGSGGTTALWAKVVRRPVRANPLGEPSEGYDDYILDIEGLPQWSQGEHPVGHKCVHDKQIWLATQVTTDEPSEESAHWSAVPGINPQHQEYGEVDWRHYVPWFVEGREVELVQRGGVYYFRSPPMRTYDTLSERQSVTWIDNEDRAAGVYA